MTLQAIFEQNRERLMSALSGAEPAAAVRVLHAELDRVLYTFNDQEESAPVREAAGSMMQAAKAACVLVDCAGETKIYGRTEYGQSAPDGRKVSKWGLLLLVLGLLGAAVTVAGGQLLASSAAAAAADWQSAGLPPRWLLAGVPLLSAAALFFAGILLRGRKADSKEMLHAETKLDASLVYHRLLSVILIMDKELEEVRSSARQEEKARLREQVSALDAAELELLSRLLEDAYGRRGEDGQAEEEISQIRFYLHKKNVDVVDWTADTAAQSGTEGGAAVVSGAWFDMIPAFSGGTIRPALAADGKLLKKGMASAGRG
ncbi:MAG: hypothetical protein IKN89_00585 [Oscillospiraceae bacterium]|nr:hypothetical protein [Oscillospiraceae bacterium]